MTVHKKENLYHHIIYVMVIVFTLLLGLVANKQVVKEYNKVKSENQLLRAAISQYESQLSDMSTEVHIKGAAIASQEAEIQLLEDTLGEVLDNQYDLPRGLRNNNPGNIVKSSIPWKGKVECLDPIHECFESSYYGIRAMLLNLKSYIVDKQLNTIEKIIHTWAEGNTQEYIEYLELLTDYNRSGIIDFNNREVIVNIAIGIIEWENGFNPYGRGKIEDIYEEL